MPKRANRSRRARSSCWGALTRGSPLYADGRIYFATTTGFAYFAADARGSQDRGSRAAGIGQGRDQRVVRRLARRCISRRRSRCIAWARPSKNGRDRTPQADPEPAGDKVATQLQVVPCELLMAPGQVQKFRVRTFNSLGQFLEEVPATFTLADLARSTTREPLPARRAINTRDNSHGQGRRANGDSADSRGAAAAMEVRLQRHRHRRSGQSRDQGQVHRGEPPITWIGIRHRHKIREIDGEKVMVKVNTIPLGTRSKAGSDHGT